MLAALVPFASTGLTILSFETVALNVPITWPPFSKVNSKLLKLMRLAEIVWAAYPEPMMGLSSPSNLTAKL